MKGVEAQDLHAGDVMAEDHIGFCAMGDEEVLGVDGREIWFDNEQEDLLDMSDTSIFYNEFPPLPDFPCMSSSSSSSSTPAPVKAITCSSSSSSASWSSSAASWAVLKSDAEEDVEKREQNNNNNNSNNSHQDHHQHGHDPVDAPPAALSSTASMEIPQVPDEGLDCMDMMETFGYMELLEGNEFIEPSSIFQNGSPFDDFQLEQEDQSQQQHAVCENPNQQQQQQQPAGVVAQTNSNNNEEEEREEEIGEAAAAAAAAKDEEDDDMASVFLEWLRSNRETVSAEDLRSVKIKKATIECAARRLGGGKEAMKQLLKLVLEWVQTNHLQKRRTTTAKETAAPSPFPNQYQQDPNNFQNPNPMNSNSFTHEPNACFNQPPPWMSHSPYDPTNVVVAAAPRAYPSPPMVGYMGTDPFVNGCGGGGVGGSNMNAHHYAATPSEYHMLDSAQTWSASQFPMPSHYTPFPDDNHLQPPPPPPPPPQAFSGYANQYPAYHQYYHGNGTGDQRLVRLGSSATKEARKKRMARQRRLLSHHRHHNHSHNHHHHHHHHNSSSQQSQNEADQHARLGSTDNCTMAAAVPANPGNWFYWPSAAAGGIPSAPPSMIHGIPAESPVVLRPVDRAQVQNYQGRMASEHRRQGWKPEKNLRFLLQKVLKQSDVGSLGRIVLPKKEAETHLPELEARDGISIAMEDIGTSRVWNMRYRYWPNNKSRMYLLENTGDFVRANGLQEGDFIVIYSDVKCGKYMIRGVKVRQQGPKSETKRPGKSQRNHHGSTPAGGNGSSSSPNKKQ